MKTIHHENRTINGHHICGFCGTEGCVSSKEKSSKKGSQVFFKSKVIAHTTMITKVSRTNQHVQIFRQTNLLNVHHKTVVYLFGNIMHLNTSKHSILSFHLKRILF